MFARKLYYKNDQTAYNSDASQHRNDYLENIIPTHVILPNFHTQLVYVLNQLELSLVVSLPVPAFPVW